MRIRKSIEELQVAYERGDKKPLETLMRAWQGIKKLDPGDFNAFFLIAGYRKIGRIPGDGLTLAVRGSG